MDQNSQKKFTLSGGSQSQQRLVLATQEPLLWTGKQSSGKTNMMSNLYDMFNKK